MCVLQVASTETTANRNEGLIHKIWERFEWIKINFSIKDHYGENFPVKYKYNHISENHKLPIFKTKYDRKNIIKVSEDDLKKVYADLGIPLHLEKSKKISSRLISRNRHSRRNPKSFFFQVAPQ